MNALKLEHSLISSIFCSDTIFNIIINDLFLTDVCSLDIALTNTLFRPQFLGVISSCQYRVRDYFKRGSNCLDWVKLRNLSLAYLGCLNSCADDHFDCKSYSKLMSLNISCCDGISVAGFNSIGLYCHNVEDLNISQMNNINDALLSLTKHCAKLTWLNVSKNVLCDESTQAICELWPQLRVINMSECRMSVKSVLAVSQSLVNITKINLQDVSTVSSESLINLREFCIKLTSVSIGHKNSMHLFVLNIPRVIWENFFSLNNNMRDISLGPECTDNLLNIISKNCLQLESLGLKNCDDVSSAGLCFVCARCRYMNSFSVIGCYGVDDSFLEAITTNRLQIMYLFLCEINVTVMGLCDILNFCLHTIKVLSIGLCNLNEYFFQFMSSKCFRALKILIIWETKLRPENADLLIQMCLEKDWSVMRLDDNENIWYSNRFDVGYGILNDDSTNFYDSNNFIYSDCNGFLIS